MLNLELYYSNISIRLFALVILSFILSHLYLKTITHSTVNDFWRQAKSLYIIHISFWLLYLTNSFGHFLPTTIIGFFSFELIVLTIIFCTLNFLFWNWKNREQFNFILLFASTPLMFLFLLALGMT